MRYEISDVPLSNERTEHTHGGGMVLLSTLKTQVWPYKLVFNMIRIRGYVGNYAQWGHDILVRFR